MMYKPLPTDRTLLIADYVALLPLRQAGLHLHHLHIVSVEGGGVAKVENIPANECDQHYIENNLTVRYLHWRF